MWQAVIDRPDEIRRVMPFKRLILTDFKCELTRLAKKKELSAALKESGEGLMHVLQMVYRSSSA